MNFYSFFIERPIATTLLALGLSLAGLLAFRALPVSSLPQIDFPTLSVQASLPGASPEVMASSVATPLERQLSHLAGITEMTSSSSLGSTRIIVQFDLSRDINGAARDVQSAIDAAQSQLPTDLPGKPTYRKVNPADAPIIILSLTSKTYTTGQMYDVASSLLQQKLSQVNGVGQVIVGGSALPGVRIELNPGALNKYGISLEQVRTTLSNTNISLPKGQLDDAQKTSDISTNDQIFKARDYAPLVVRYQKGAPIRISDLGEAVDSVEDLRNAGLANGKPSVLLVVFKSPGANVIEAVQNVRDVMPYLKEIFPKEIEMDVMMDRTTTIHASLQDVERTLCLAILFVVLVIYFFLRDARTALVPSISIPLSLLGTFGIMHLLGFSLNNLSLMALTITTGFVVDDAIVVLENIKRHIEGGLKPLAAARQGIEEVGFTVLSMSLSLIAVFIPVILMSGIVGKLLREFALTLAISIVMSLIVSLTVTPMMCARFIKPSPKNPSRPATKDFFHRAHHHYSHTLKWALDHPRLLLQITLITIGINVALFIFIPKGFFPQQDTGRIQASIQARQDISFQSMKQKLATLVKIIQEDPAVETVAGFVGGSGMTATTNAGSLYISLKPLHVRKVSVDTIIQRLRPRLAHVPGATLYLRAVQDLVIGGRQGNAQYQYTLTAYTLDDLNTWVPRIQQRLAKIPGIVDLNSDQLNKGLQVFVHIDRDKAALYGLTAQKIDDVLYDAFGQRQVSTLYTPLNQYHVVMEVAPKYWQNPDTFQNIYVVPSTGKTIPLSTFAHFNLSSTLLQVNHQSQFPATTLSFNLQPGIALGDVVQKIEQAMQEMHLPVGSIHGSFQGTAQAFQESLANQSYLILAALMAVYIVLGILYESVLHPVTILSTLPSAGVGALLALLITGAEFSLMALIGVILLIGIVKKNAIMMIDFALDLERSGHKTAKEAIYEACLLRFRPILMTTMAALLSAVPMAFGQGVGSELRRPLGIAIIGGLLLSQILTLYTTPVIYLTFENWALWRKAQWRKMFPTPPVKS